MPLETTIQPQKTTRPRKTLASPPSDRLGRSERRPGDKLSINPAANSSAQPLRFFKDGYWWEVEKKIQSRQSNYYQCRPTCWKETRFYSAQEITLAIQSQQKRKKIQSADSRGSGRITLTSSQPGRQEPCKLLLVGSKQAVQGAIVKLHTLGYADADRWSAIQPGRKSKEVVSILVHRLTIA